MVFLSCAYLSKLLQHKLETTTDWIYIDIHQSQNETMHNSKQSKSIQVRCIECKDMAIISIDKDFNAAAAAAVCGRRRHRMTAIGSRQERSDLVNASESGRCGVHSFYFILCQVASAVYCATTTTYSSARPPQSDLQSDNKDVFLPILPSRCVVQITL